MELADAQLWFGFLLVFSGFSIHRMGPAFRRSRFGKPMMLLGLVSSLFHSGKLSDMENKLLDNLILNLPWMVLALLGSSLVLYGAPIYWKKIFSTNSMGLITIFISWIIYVNFTLLSHDVMMFSLFFTLLGMFLALLFIIWIIKIIESRTPKALESEPLTESEEKFIISILKRHVGGE